jgi:ACT domain-containing protein
MKAIITVIGKDRVGIIAEICTLLAAKSVNVLDISQTVMQENFTMTMLVDASACRDAFADLADELKAAGDKMGLAIRAQREDIFNAMHRI